MPVNEEINANTSSGNFPPIPTDVYQVEIKDVSTVKSKKYQSTEEQTQLNFKFVILDEGEHRGRFLQAWTTLTWFSGGGQRSPSKLYLLIKSVHDFYYKDKKSGVSAVAEWTADMITSAVINDLIGKQLRVSSSEIPTGGKVTAFMPVKSALPEWKQEEAPHPAETESDTVTV